MRTTTATSLLVALALAGCAGGPESKGPARAPGEAASGSASQAGYVPAEAIWRAAEPAPRRAAPQPAGARVASAPMPLHERPDAPPAVVPEEGPDLPEEDRAIVVTEPEPGAGQVAVAVLGTPFYLAFKGVVCGASLVIAAPSAALIALADGPGSEGVDILGDGVAQNCGPPYVLTP